MNIKWDAGKYTKDFSFVHQYGNDVAELINCEKGGASGLFHEEKAVRE